MESNSYTDPPPRDRNERFYPTCRHYPLLIAWSVLDRSVLDTNVWSLTPASFYVDAVPILCGHILLVYEAR